MYVCVCRRLLYTRDYVVHRSLHRRLLCTYATLVLLTNRSVSPHHTDTHTCMYTHTHKHTNTRMYTHTHACTHTHTQAYTHLYTHTHLGFTNFYAYINRSQNDDLP